MQKRYVRKNGEIIWINLTASVIRGDDSAPLYGLAIVEDITEVKRMQEESLARQKLESVARWRAALLTISTIFWAGSRLKRSWR